MRQGPLKGLRVVEFAGIGPGPFAAMLLADMGADVVRIDRPEARARKADVTLRGRRIIALDLKTQADQALALCDQAEVLIEGFRPGVMERLGLGPEVVCARNPKLVYGRMTGWGQSGPLAPYAGHVLAERIGLVPILRAGLGMVEPIIDMIPTAHIWHLGLYRDHDTLQPVSYYNKLPPEVNIDVALVLDPMLATGGSASAAVTVLKQWGVKRITFLGLIAAPEGVALMQREHPDVPLYLAAIDEKLNDIGYIMPGLGDAGDRQFGTY